MDRERIVIKVPVTRMGTRAASLLIHSRVRVCLTAAYDSSQALLAASVGAEYIAPYLGRMSDRGKNGRLECERMHTIVNGLRSSTRILVASIRDKQSLADLSSKGLDTFTVSPAVAYQLFDEPLTERAAAEFELAAYRGNLD